MRYAETGFNLEVDLTRGNIERVATDPRLAELFGADAEEHVAGDLLDQIRDDLFEDD